MIVSSQYQIDRNLHRQCVLTRHHIFPLFLGFIMLTQPCFLWLNPQTSLSCTVSSDIWIVGSTDRMMTMSAPIWKTLLVCPADPLTLSHPQANHSQSEGRRGEGPEENQHLIGELQWIQFFIFPSFRWAPHCSTFRSPWTVSKTTNVDLFYIICRWRASLMLPFTFWI